MEFTSDDKDLEHRQRDFDDLQHELVGRDVGKISRFLAENDDRSAEARRRKREKEADQRRLADFLLDPVYRATHERLGRDLSAAETDADQTIQSYEIAIQVAEQRLLDMETGAARGPDGEPVFRYADGRVVDAEGRTLAPEIAAGINWPPDAPSAEAYFGAKEHLEALSLQLNQWHSYRTDTLGSIRDRYDSEDDPMSLDELEDALDQIDRARPPRLSLEETPSAAGASVNLTPSEFPKIGS